MKASQGRMMRIQRSRVKADLRRWRRRLQGATGPDQRHGCEYWVRFLTWHLQQFNFSKRF